MKTTVDEIQQATARLAADRSHLFAFGLGAVLVAVAMTAIGRGPAGSPAPAQSGVLKSIMEQTGDGSWQGESYERGQDIRGRIYDRFVVVESSESIRVIPAERLREAVFYR